MATNNVLTAEDHKLIKELALKGETLAAIAGQLSVTVSRQRIKQITQRYGINAFNIRQKKQQSEHNNKMFKRFGQQWNNDEYRKTAIYQEMQSKFRIKRHNANRQGIEFTVTFGELEFPAVCPVLGIELDYFAPPRSENTVTFDRIDHTKGYVSGNVAIMSWRANRIKNNGTAQEHELIANFMKSTAFVYQPFA